MVHGRIAGVIVDQVNVETRGRDSQERLETIIEKVHAIKIQDKHRNAWGVAGRK